MSHTPLKLLLLTALLAGGSAVAFLYRDHDGERARRVAAERKNEQLKQVIGRLSAERRVADIVVTDQRVVATPTAAPTQPVVTTQRSAPDNRTASGNLNAPDNRTTPTQPPTPASLQTTLLFVEYARDGSPLPAKRFTFEGNVAHLDAMVIKFDGKFVEENDPLRGRSIALFTRLYGQKQPPDKGFRVDEPDKIPHVYRGQDPRVQDFERDLWANFWRLADDEAYRTQMGVRVAQGEGVWTRFLPDRLYTLTLESDGGLNITSTPLKGIYREALKRPIDS